MKTPEDTTEEETAKRAKIRRWRNAAGICIGLMHVIAGGIFNSYYLFASGLSTAWGFLLLGAINEHN
jgi:hypothetical protein